MNDLLPRRVAIPTLLALGCLFAANHVASRIAFDHGTGVLFAMLMRTGVTALVLTALVAWRRPTLRLPPGSLRWLLLVGPLMAVQGLLMYSAVARIPVALALLVTNVYPLLLVLLTWALGGARPTGRTSLLMGLILFGLALALDVPGRLAERSAMRPEWSTGIAQSFGAAVLFAFSLWVNEHKLRALPGTVRSMLLLWIALSTMAAIALAGLLPEALSPPQDGTGRIALAVLLALYCVGFSIFFVLMPRLDMLRNASVLNIEPVATLLLGWLVLGQTLGGMQLAGGAVVLLGIVLLAYRGRG